MRRLVLRHLLLITSLVAASIPDTGLAGLVITAEPLTLSASGAGSSGRLALTISSTNGTDLLDLFGFEFRLTSANSHYISFVDPPADSQLGDPSYIFHNDSVGELAGPPSGLVTSSLNPGDTYIGGDGTISGLGVTVPTEDPSSWKLLVVLDITANTGSGVEAGDVFLLGLVQGPATFFLGPIPDSGDPDPLDVRFDGVPITISTAVTPEPHSLTLAAMGLGVFSLAHSKKRRQEFDPQTPHGSQQPKDK